MSKKKIWLIIASALCVLGTLLFIVAMSILQWDFKKLSTIKYVDTTYEYTESIADINIVTKTADIEILPAAPNTTTIVCHDQENIRHEVKLEDGTLSINVKDERKFGDYIGINFDSAKITISLPIHIYNSLSITTSTSDITIKDGFRFESMDIKNGTGDVYLKHLSAGTFNLTLTTGDITIEDFACESFASTGNTGDVNLKSVIVTGDISVTRSTGDISLNSCDGANLYLKTSTGDVEGSLLSGKNFTAKTSTGDCNVPANNGIGNCKITTTTGDIEIRIA